MVTEGDRATRCITGWAVVWDRTTAALPDVVEGTAPATQDYADGFSTYQTLAYDPGRPAVASGKGQT